MLGIEFLKVGISNHLDIILKYYIEICLLILTETFEVKKNVTVQKK